MKITQTGSISISINGPKNIGTYDPNNEEDEDVFTHVMPESYEASIDENDKFKTEA